MPKNSPILQISARQARRFLLDHQFLLTPHAVPPEEIAQTIFSRLGCIQFDTINVVGRNADLVLQARVKGYRQSMLENLLYQDRSLIDGWDKMASIIRAEDWPYFEYHRERMSAYHRTRSQEAADAIPEIRKAVAAQGPLSSLEFKSETKTDWFWGPTSVARAALEIMFAQGILGIHHRVNTRRYFDLIERLLPAEMLAAPNPNPTHEAYLHWHLHRRIGSMGLAATNAGEYWYGVSNGYKASTRTPILDSLHQQGRITQVEVAELPGKTIYIRTEDLERLENVSLDDLPDPQAAFIAPLDNLIWNRSLIGDLFDFDYTWEVYKPKDQRQYGYYVLPVLFGDRFIARTNLKFDPKQSDLALLGWWWESDIEPDQAILSASGHALADFRQFVGAERISFQPELTFSKQERGLINTLLEQAS
jgi:uncharacterized protein YcaQ